MLPIGRAPGKKYPPPAAFTGHGKPDPSGADVQAWLDGPEGTYNIGLRLPAGVVGLDVDAYPGKRGGEALAELIAKHGELPPTWITSARTDGVSGIRLYRVPELLDGRPINWPGEAGKHIEIIQHGHRYAVVWPSTNPEAAGAVYRWRFEAAQDLRGDAVPQAGELAWLPEAWVRGLALSYDRTEKAALAGSDLASWWDELRGGYYCPVVEKVFARACADLLDVNGARHETTRDAAAALARLGGEGHRGVRAALTNLGAAFEHAVGTERVAAGEWQRLLSGAVKLAAADNPTPRQSCPDDAPTTLPAALLPPAPASSFSGPAETTIGSAVDVSAGGLTLPEEFWQARESLSRIRQAAHSRVRSGDVVFYGTLARLAAMAPYTLRADTGIGTPASLNLFAAIVGPSGGGKSSGLSVGRELVKQGARPLEEFPLGSGEGVAEAYMGETMQPTGEMARDGSEKLAKVRTMVRHNVLFHSDEGNSLNKLIERVGSTVGETLRSAWSGETIGQKNGRTETTRTVPARAYACGVVIGYQPTTVLPLLADYEAGTPQRFLYAWAVDGTIPPRASRVLWPGELPSPFPPDVPTSLPAAGTVIAAPPAMLGESIHFAESILDELYEIEHAKNTGGLPADHPLRDPFRSQHPVLKVKVAALLALLESRRAVTEDDWQLAQIVLDTSDRVRDYLLALRREAAGKARAALLAAEHETETHRAHARQAVTEALEQTAERRVAARVAQRVHEGGEMSLGALRKLTAARDRALVEQAVEIAVAAGWLVYGGPDGRVHPGPSRPTI